ncbi:hypothetical protein Bbelb_278450 [Branchiostoma belcheri]|nr:hypothetical protein Bbelb_278450 [Branchiostoma belcheri]
MRESIYTVDGMGWGLQPVTANVTPGTVRVTLGEQGPLSADGDMGFTAMLDGREGPRTIWMTRKLEALSQGNLVQVALGDDHAQKVNSAARCTNVLQRSDVAWRRWERVPGEERWWSSQVVHKTAIADDLLIQRLLPPELQDIILPVTTPKSSGRNTKSGLVGYKNCSLSEMLTAAGGPAAIALPAAVGRPLSQRQYQQENRRQGLSQRHPREDRRQWLSQRGSAEEREKWLKRAAEILSYNAIEEAYRELRGEATPGWETLSGHNIDLPYVSIHNAEKRFLLVVPRPTLGTYQSVKVDSGVRKEAYGEVRDLLGIKVMASFRKLQDQDVTKQFVMEEGLGQVLEKNTVQCVGDQSHFHLCQKPVVMTYANIEGSWVSVGWVQEKDKKRVLERCGDRPEILFKEIRGREPCNQSVVPRSDLSLAVKVDVSYHFDRGQWSRHHLLFEWGLHVLLLHYRGQWSRHHLLFEWGLHVLLLHYRGQWS